MRLLLVLLLTALIFNRFGDWLGRFGLGRLPGDLRFRIGRREWHLPVGSSLVLTAIAAAIAYVK